MALVHNGVTLFGGNTHTNIMKGPYDMPMQIGQFFGLVGESHLIGLTKGRDLWCNVDVLNYSTRGRIESSITALQNYINQPLFGTLRIIYPNNNYNNYVNCTLTGVHEDPEGIKYEASNGTYRTKVTFTWRQAN
ncbi:MAG: hypothetical protein RIC33_18830 [Gimesia maris]